MPVAKIANAILKSIIIISNNFCSHWKIKPEMWRILLEMGIGVEAEAISHEGGGGGSIVFHRKLFQFCPCFPHFNVKDSLTVNKIE